MTENKLIQIFKLEHWIRKENMTAQLGRWLSGCIADIYWEIWTCVYLIQIGNKQQTQKTIWPKTNLLASVTREFMWGITYNIRNNTMAATSLKGTPKHRWQLIKAETVSSLSQLKVSWTNRESIRGGSA